MLGRLDSHRCLLDADSLPHRVPPDSIYARMAALGDRLFPDDDLEDLHDPDNGRPSLPPSIMSGALLLQFHDDVSDQEAAERILYDLRWKVALHLPLDYAGFDASSLSRYRSRLVEGSQERYAFDRFVAVGRAAGFIPDKVALLHDTTWTKGAGAVQDSYTLLRKGIRKVLKQLDYAVPARRKKLSPQVQRLTATYLEQDRKAQIDWTDPQQRAAQLKVLVQDAEAALDIASQHADDAQVRQTGWLST
jgi:transposase